MISASFGERSPLQTQRHRGILILLRVILYFSLCLCASVVKSFTHTKQRRAIKFPKEPDAIAGDKIDLPVCTYASCILL
jgi:hypothetical protein